VRSGFDVGPGRDQEVVKPVPRHECGGELAALGDLFQAGVSTISPSTFCR
jgi:hypothetical protein